MDLVERLQWQYLLRRGDCHKLSEPLPSCFIIALTVCLWRPYPCSIYFIFAVRMESIVLEEFTSHNVASRSFVSSLMIQ